jgi:hypothetical protein
MSEKELWVQFACAALDTSYVLNKAVESQEPMPVAMAQYAAEVADAMMAELQKRTPQ